MTLTEIFALKYLRDHSPTEWNFQKNSVALTLVLLKSKELQY